MRLVLVMFDEYQKQVMLPNGVGGLDVRLVATESDYYHASEVSELDRNEVFFEFNSIRIKSNLVFALESSPEVTSFFTRALSEKWVFPYLVFQLGYFPSLRAEVAGHPYYLLDKFRFVDARMVRMWPHRKLFVGDDSFNDLIQVSFSDSNVKDFGDTEHPIR